MKNIAVVIRTFSRVDDTKALVEIIDRYWTSHNYTLFVAFNGASSGYELDASVYEKTTVIEVAENTGHYSGASDLIKKGYEKIQDSKDFDYVIFIESDFWLLNEDIIHKAITANKDLSATIWVEKRGSISVDFFVIKKEALDRCPEILIWQEKAEQTFKKSIEKAGLSLYIFEELRSIHAPGMLKSVCKNFVKKYAVGGRFKLFYNAKAISHHTEELYDSHYTGTKENNLSKEEKMQIAMPIKKSIANTILGEEFFKDCGFYEINFFEKHAPSISKCIPQKAWLNKVFGR